MIPICFLPFAFLGLNLYLPADGAGLQRPGQTNLSPGFQEPRPPAGKTWLFIGQDLDSVADYRRRVAPSQYETSYSDLVKSHMPVGLTQVNRGAAGALHVAQSAGRSAALSLGIYMVDNTGHVAAGECGKQIDAYGDLMGAHGKTLFLTRLGYEFDGPWNHYPPRDYVRAFQTVVSRWRSNGVTNFAAVWQSCAYGNAVTASSLEAYYPGDRYVDWVGLSYFSQSPRGAQEAVLQFARLHQKPVMICEASPQGYQIDELTWAPAVGRPIRKIAVSPEVIWRDWFGPFFHFIYEHGDQIRAVAYIHADWDSQDMWGPKSRYQNGYWGDSRLGENETILRLWRAEIHTRFWMR